jgi:hypothetical protein
LWNVHSLQGEGDTEGSQTVQMFYVDGATSTIWHPNRERARYQAARYSITPQLTTGSKWIDYPVMYGGGWCGRNLKTCRRPGLGQIRVVDWDKVDSAQPHHTVRNVANLLRREVERGPLPHRTLRSQSRPSQ